MPNWCSNCLKVSGTKAEMAKFLKVAIQNRKFRLGNVFPVPEALQDVHCGGCTIDGEHVRNWRTEKDAKGNDVNIKVDVEQLIKAYGYADWYEWSIHNWGTKWDVDAKYKIQHDKTEFVAHFDSAWSHPVLWLEKLAEKFPELKGELAYAEGGCGFWGVLYFDDGYTRDVGGSGSFWRHMTDEEQEDDNIETIDRVLPEVRRHLEHYGINTGG